MTHVEDVPIAVGAQSSLLGHSAPFYNGELPIIEYGSSRIVQFNVLVIGDIVGVTLPFAVTL